MMLIIRWFKNLLLPPLCSICYKRVGQDSEPICLSCALELTHPDEPICKVCGGESDTVLECCSECLDNGNLWIRGYTVWKYEGAIREAIHRYKYRGEIALADFFANNMAEKIKLEEGIESKVLTWIPLHPIKKFIRGYNQTELLSKRLSGLLNIPCKKLIDRVKCTRQQAKLDRHDRQKNMKNAFKINRRNGADIKGADVLLLDDVLTTGSTLNEASRVLLKNGAQSVTVISIARG